tara:strand:- start:941 stop:1576 length:636 start_codon:yes stop_codon:yes gene_type:complete
MPAVSKSVVIQKIFESLVEMEDFKYSIEELYEFLKQTDIKIPKKSDNTRATSAYDCFLKVNKTKKFGDNQELSELWNSVKNDDKQIDIYNKMALDANISKGFQLNSEGTDIIRNTVSANAKLIDQIICLKKQDAELKGNSFEDKPIFYGKKSHTSLNNFKEWLKSHLELPSNHSFNKSTLDIHKNTHSFDSSIYNDDQPWFEYISKNMIQL